MAEVVSQCVHLHLLASPFLCSCKGTCTTNGFKRPDKHGQGGGRIGDDGDDAAGDAGDVDIAGEMLMLLLMMSR